MFYEYLQKTVIWLKRVVTQPRDELNRWQRTLRYSYDLMVFGGEQLKHDRAPQMAAAMAFRSLFALLPVLIVTTIVIKATRGKDTMLTLAHDIFHAVGLDRIQFVPRSSNGGGDGALSQDMMQDTTAGVGEPDVVSLAEWLEGLLGQAVNVNLSAVGWIGFTVIIYAAISLMVTIENSFNTVYRASEGRPWYRRVPLYWFVLTVSPVALGVAWYVNQLITNKVATVEWWHPWANVAGIAWNLVLTSLFLTLVYLLIPNATVALRPALIGAVVAAILLEIAKRFMSGYLENAFSISQLYGSLGLIPVFMFWVYGMWLVVLFGLELSATLQHFGGRELQSLRHFGANTVRLFDPTSVVLVGTVVARQFMAGQAASPDKIAQQCDLPEALVSAILEELISAGVVHRLEDEEPRYSLARPPRQIPAQLLLGAGYQLVGMSPRDTPAAVLGDVRQRHMAAVNDVTLAELAASGTDP